tara:strand:+ start:155 stop:763 length:609 start_codon:yes stop_codon:yes gene_type:complete
MKKILNEWNRWLFETEKTEKFLGQPTRKRTGHHDRAVVKIHQQSTFRKSFKEIFGNELRSVHSHKAPTWFFSKLKPAQKAKITNDLNIMKYIYSGKSDFEIVDVNNVRSGIIFDNQPDVVNNPVAMIDGFLKILGTSAKSQSPTQDEIKEVYIYYIKPNYAAVTGPPSAPSKVSPFSKHLSFTADQLAKMNRDLRSKNKRKK